MSNYISMRQACWEVRPYLPTVFSFLIPSLRLQPLTTTCDCQQKIISEASGDTEVYFCGGGGINTLLRQTCAKRGIKYVGSAVQ